MSVKFTREYLSALLKGIFFIYAENSISVESFLNDAKMTISSYLWVVLPFLP
jgi:hypothetical protein